MGSGIQWFFFKYQTTFVGDSVIPLATNLHYVFSGTITGKSAFYEVSPLLSVMVLVIAFAFIITNQTGRAGIFTIASGILSLSASFVQYGFSWHGPAGTYIPFGSIILVVYGTILLLSNPSTEDEILCKKYSYLFLLGIVFLVYCNWANPFPMNDTYGSESIPFSVLNNHTIFLDEAYLAHADDGNIAYRFVRVEGGHYASVFPVVTPVLITPLYVIPYLFGVPFSDLLQFVMAHIASALIAALSVVFIYLACRYLTSRKIALLTAFIFAFATSTWSISSQYLYAHGMSELLLAVMIFLIVRNEAKTAVSNILLLGICSGLYVFNRPSDAVLILPVIGYVIWYQREKIAYYFIPAIIAGLPFLSYNLLLFHSIFGGYARVASRLSFDPGLVSNFFGLLIAPNRGLFIFTPVMILAVIGFWYIRKDPKPFSRFLMGSLVAMVVTVMIYASFDDWQGGETFGPRYLTCILPYLAIGLCIFFQDLAQKPRDQLVTGVIVMLIVFSVFVQVIGVIFYRGSTYPQEYYPNEFCSYDAWAYTDLVIVNSLFQKSARPVIRNDNGTWLRTIIQEQERTFSQERL